MKRTRKPKGILWSPGSAPRKRMKGGAAKLWRKLEKLEAARKAKR